MSYRRILAGLEGVFCVYKPADLSISGLRKIIVKRIVSEGNDAVGWPRLPNIQIPIVEPHEKSGALLVVGERELPDYSLHPLVSGEPFRSEDLRVEELNYMEPSSSGVCVLGLNDSCEQLPNLLARSWVSEYRLEGMLGRETLNHQIKGRVTLRAPFEHITRHKLLKLLTKIQASYRKAAFEAAEVDLQSEEAFEIARKGIPRSQLPNVPLIYNIELDSFTPPYFALHVHASGENDNFLRCFVHEIGVSLGTTACCVRLQRRSIGPLTSNHAILEKHISLQNIIRNVQTCRRLIESSHDDPTIIKEKETNEHKEIEERKLLDALGMYSQAEEVDHMRPAWPRDYN